MKNLRWYPCLLITLTLNIFISPSSFAGKEENAEKEKVAAKVILRNYRKFKERKEIEQTISALANRTGGVPSRMIPELEELARVNPRIFYVPTKLFGKGNVYVTLYEALGEDAKGVLDAVETTLPGGKAKQILEEARIAHKHLPSRLPTKNLDQLVETYLDNKGGLTLLSFYDVPTICPTGRTIQHGAVGGSVEEAFANFLFPNQGWNTRQSRLAGLQLSDIPPPRFEHDVFFNRGTMDWLNEKGLCNGSEWREIRVSKTLEGQIKAQFLLTSLRSNPKILKEIVAPTFSQALSGVKSLAAHQSLKRIYSKRTGDARMKQALDEVFQVLDHEQVAKFMATTGFFKECRLANGELANFDELHRNLADEYIAYCKQVAMGKDAKFGTVLSQTPKLASQNSNTRTSNSASSASPAN